MNKKGIAFLLFFAGLLGLFVSSGAETLAEGLMLAVPSLIVMLVSALATRADVE